MNTNEANTAEKNKEKDDLVARIDDLTNTVNTLANEIKGLENSVAEMELQNKSFQETVADQRATQKLLGTALGILQGFYGAALVQKQGGKQEQLAGQAPPPGF